MKIDIPKIVRPLYLNEYAPELGSAVIHVWVNPPRAIKDRYTDLFGQIKDTKPGTPEFIELSHQFAAWYAEIWSQGPVETRWTPEEVEQVAEYETDPQFYRWLVKRSWALIDQHQMGEQKK